MTEKTLKNGLKVVVNPKESDFVTMAFYVNKGAIDEKDNELGIAHLVEHMVFKGTVNYTKKTVWTEIQKNGGQLNAYTDTTHTVFYVHCLKEFLEDAFNVIFELVFLNTIPKEEFDLEKSVVIEELKMYENQIENQANYLLNSTLTPNIKNRYNVGGTPETVAKITRQQVVDFIARNYIPNNITFYATGDVDSKYFEDKIEENLTDFEFIKSSPQIRTKNPKYNFADVKGTKDGSQSAMIAYYPMNLKDVKEVVMDMISEYVLSGGFNSRLMKIREEYGYVYSISADTDFDYVGDDGVTTIFMQLNNQNIPKTKEIIEESLAEYYENGVTEDEFATAVNNCKFDIRKCFETVNATNQVCIAHRDCGMPETEESMMEVLNSVTFDDFNNFVKEKYANLTVNYIVVEQTR